MLLWSGGEVYIDIDVGCGFRSVALSALGVEQQRGPQVGWGERSRRTNETCGDCRIGRLELAVSQPWGHDARIATLRNGSGRRGQPWRNDAWVLIVNGDVHL